MVSSDRSALIFHLRVVSLCMAPDYYFSANFCPFLPIVLFLCSDFLFCIPQLRLCYYTHFAALRVYFGEIKVKVFKKKLAPGCCQSLCDGSRVRVGEFRNEFADRNQVLRAASGNFIRDSLFGGTATFGGIH